MPSRSTWVAEMTDLLALLDQAIDGLAPAGSSRCSRSGLNETSPTGTLKPLKPDTVPVVPVLPGQNGEARESNAHSHEISSLNFFPSEKSPRESIILKTPGTTGTTGTSPENQHLSVPKTFFENGNNGNNPVRSPVVALDAYMRAALRRPVSWADPAARPSPGAFCSCCKGKRWWGDARGWRCWQCHPPDGAPAGSVTEVRT